MWFRRIFNILVLVAVCMNTLDRMEREKRDERNREFFNQLTPLIKSGDSEGLRRLGENFGLED